MQPNLKKFVDEIFSINPAQANTLVPGSGASNSFGASAIDVLNKLRQSTSKFAEQKTADSNALDKLETLAQTIEGCLLNLQVLNEISSDLATRLIEEVHSISKE